MFQGRGHRRCASSGLPVLVSTVPSPSISNDVRNIATYFTPNGVLATHWSWQELPDSIACVSLWRGFEAHHSKVLLPGSAILPSPCVWSSLVSLSWMAPLQRKYFGDHATHLGWRGLERIPAGCYRLLAFLAAGETPITWTTVCEFLRACECVGQLFTPCERWAIGMGRSVVLMAPRCAK